MKLIKGLLSAFILLTNTVFWVPILLVFSLFKLLLPLKHAKIVLSRIIVGIAEIWVTINSSCYRWIHGEKITITGLNKLAKDDWYLVVCNHVSAADIPVVQSVFNRQIPFLKFFLKKQLIWVPFLGLAWWALDFPFMRRYSRDFIAKNPHMKGKDLDVTRKACEKFKDFPISVINFVEGTRFTPKKHAQQNSTYKNLLTPKAGGLGFVLGSMGEQINTLLLVSLKYQPKPPGLWEYLSGSFDKVTVNIESITIPQTLKNKNYITNEAYKKELQSWVNQLWEKQDQTIEKI